MSTCHLSKMSSPPPSPPPPTHTHTLLLVSRIYCSVCISFYSQESPKKRTCQSVSNITDKESPKLVKYHSSNVFDDSSPGQRFRAVSSSKKQKQSVHRSRTTATGRPLAAGVKRPTSIMGGDTSSIHSRSVNCFIQCQVSSPATPPKNGRGESLGS